MPEPFHHHDLEPLQVEDFVVEHTLALWTNARAPLPILGYPVGQTAVTKVVLIVVPQIVVFVSSLVGNDLIVLMASRDATARGVMLMALCVGIALSILLIHNFGSPGKLLRKAQRFNKDVRLEWNGSARVIPLSEQDRDTRDRDTRGILMQARGIFTSFYVRNEKTDRAFYEHRSGTFSAHGGKYGGPVRRNASRFLLLAMLVAAGPQWTLMLNLLQPPPHAALTSLFSLLCFLAWAVACRADTWSKGIFPFSGWIPFSHKIFPDITFYRTFSEECIFPEGDLLLPENIAFENYWYSRSWFLLSKELSAMCSASAEQKLEYVTYGVRKNYSAVSKSKQTKALRKAARANKAVVCQEEDRKHLYTTAYTIQSKTGWIFYFFVVAPCLLLALEPCTRSETRREEFPYVVLNIVSIIWVVPVFARINEGLYCLRLAQKNAELLHILAKTIHIKGTDNDKSDVYNWHACAQILYEAVTNLGHDFGKDFALVIVLSILGSLGIVYRFVCRAGSGPDNKLTCGDSFEETWHLLFASCAYGISALVILFYAYKLDVHYKSAARFMAVGSSHGKRNRMRRVSVAGPPLPGDALPSSPVSLFADFAD
jgi:hypothetical protein